MLLELQKGKKTVGRKQSQRAILDGKAEKIYLADDADQRIREETEKLCETHGVPVISVDTMENLGKACGIQVGAAVAALLKAQ